MELVKNKASGRSFIVIDDDGGEYIQLITPEGKVKSLERRLFGPLVEFDSMHNKENQYVTNKQMKKYAEYFDE